MASYTELANTALTLLGEQPIIDFTDESDNALVLNRIFHPTVDAILCSHPWASATFRRTLSQVTPDPIFDWSFQYSLPTDPWCLRVLAANDDQSSALRGEMFAIEGRRLLTNATAVHIRYLGRVSDVGQIDAALYLYLATSVAAAAAMAITGNANLAGQIRNEARFLERKAILSDGQQGNTPVPFFSPLANARLGF